MAPGSRVREEVEAEVLDEEKARIREAFRAETEQKIKDEVRIAINKDNGHHHLKTEEKWVE